MGRAGGDLFSNVGSSLSERLGLVHSCLLNWKVHSMTFPGLSTV